MTLLPVFFWLLLRFALVGDDLAHLDDGHCVLVEHQTVADGPDVQVEHIGFLGGGHHGVALLLKGFRQGLAQSGILVRVAQTGTHGLCHLCKAGVHTLEGDDADLLALGQRQELLVVLDQNNGLLVGLVSLLLGTIEVIHAGLIGLVGVEVGLSTRLVRNRLSRRL